MNFEHQSHNKMTNNPVAINPLPSLTAPSAESYQIHRSAVDPKYARQYVKKWRDAAGIFISEKLNGESMLAAQDAVDRVVSPRLAYSVQQNDDHAALLSSSREILGEKGELTRAIAEAIHGVTGGDLAVIQRSLLECFIGGLSHEAWVPVEESHYTRLSSRADSSTGSTDELSRGEYRSRTVPLNGAFAAEFPGASEFCKYRTRGVPSAALKVPPIAALEGAPRLANGWVTTLANPEGEVIFDAIRSASLVHYGIKDPKARHDATDAAALELLRAATVLEVERRSKRTSGEDRAGEPLRVRLASFELQTRPESDRDDAVAKKFAIERNTVDEEYQALKRLEGIKTVMIDSALKQVAVELVSFNYPVHEKSYQERLGFGGETGERTAESTERLLDEARLVVKDGESGYAPSTREKLDILVEEVTEMLSGDIAEITDDPYRFNSRLMNIASLLGYVVHVNCRSGKDRTGIVDAEAKSVAEALDVAVTNGNRSLAFNYQRPLNADEQATVYHYAVRSGTVDVQRFNTGVAGSKMKPVCSKEIEGDPLPRRIGKENWLDFKGLSYIAET